MRRKSVMNDDVDADAPADGPPFSEAGGSLLRYINKARRIYNLNV